MANQFQPSLSLKRRKSLRALLYSRDAHAKKKFSLKNDCTNLHLVREKFFQKFLLLQNFFSEAPGFPGLPLHGERNLYQRYNKDTVFIDKHQRNLYT